MSRIIITGHPASGLEEVEELLVRSGMMPALHSRREGMLPEEVTSTLCKAHNAPSVRTPASESEFRQFEVDSVWHSLILDLLLGNSDQELWGWADSQAIFLLDHWRSLDQQTFFLLVYDQPHGVLLKAAQSSNEAMEGVVMRQHLLNWQAYNGAMLRFYLRNPERCLLINARQVASDATRFVSLLQNRLHMPNAFALPGPVQGTNGQLPKGELAKSVEQALLLTGGDPADTLRAIHAEDVEYFIVNKYLEDHPAYLDVYQELEASADIPFDDRRPARINNLNAWSGMLKQRHSIAGLLNHVVGEYHKLSDLRTREASEREWSLGWLARVQDQLESVFQENRHLKKLADGLKNELEVLHKRTRQAERTEEPKGAPRGAADLVKKHLSYRLGSTMVSRARSVGGWCRMPLDLVMVTRSYYHEKSVDGNSKQPPLRSYEDYHEAERVMGQLSYRLGNVFVKNSRSPIGWIKIPFMLLHQINDFYKSRPKR